ncbi:MULTISPECIES: hypothetical protein [unclassified Microbacterium]|uniref:hypothetical protein n=1 Tax=unclassified Microbacterium TaxID=2609290 RepID=UPI001FCEC9A8|nr:MULTISPECIES: hypothetical protein [unclassified Microbacterium]
MTARTMTIYLWHMPVLLVMAGATAVYALTTGAVLPALDSPDWWAARPLWLATSLALTGLVAVALARFESEPAPRATASATRLAVGAVSGLVGVVLLLALGTSVATALLAVALIVGALRLAAAGGSLPSSGAPTLVPA